MNIIFFFLALGLFASMSFAATTGNINFSTANNTGIVTGVWGSTYNFYCNTNATCTGTDKCILDYDDNSANFSGTVYKGWCAPSSETRCRHESTYTASGSKLCDGAARSCSSGTWTSTTCSANQTCSSGECVASSSSPGSGGGGSSNTTAPPPPPISSGLEIFSLPPDLSIIQGGSVLKEIIVKNTGNITLPAVSLSISGIEWYNVAPSSTNISKGFSSTFTVNFTIPENAEVKEYAVTVEAKNGTALGSKSFKIRVLPSNKTVENTILPLYSNYTELIAQLENNVTELQNKGADVTELKNILNSIKDKLNQANSSLGSQDYFTANVLLNDAKQLISDLQAKMSSTSPPKPQEFNLLLIIIPVIIGVAGVLAYLFWPTKK